MIVGQDTWTKFPVFPFLSLAASQWGRGEVEINNLMIANVTYVILNSEFALLSPWNCHYAIIFIPANT